jgi:hypothetical protein
MTKNAPSPLLTLIRRLAQDPRLRHLSDQELLARFRADRDEAAFRGLLQREAINSSARSRRQTATG